MYVTTLYLFGATIISSLCDLVILVVAGEAKKDQVTKAK